MLEEEDKEERGERRSEKGEGSGDWAERRRESIISGEDGRGGRG